MRTLASLTGVAAATLSLSACAPYPDEPGDTPPAAGCPAYKARDFKAWIDTMPGPGARPTLQALPAGLREEFADELRRRLRAAYPPRGGRVVLPFRRAFAVARVPA